MDILIIIILILLGVILLVVEFMLIPGLTVAGIGSLISFGLSIYYAFKHFSTLVGIITLLVVLIFVPIMLYLFFKGKAMKPMMLESEIDSKVEIIEENEIKKGDQGESIGRLAPSGKIKINGKAFEARTLGLFVDPHTPIEVIKTEGNIAIVKPINSEK